MQPGETITPGKTDPKPELTAYEPDRALPPQDQKSDESLLQTEQAAPGLAFQSDASLQTEDTYEPQLPGDEISWTASEYVAHEKTPLWYIILGVCTVLAAGGIYLITREKITPIVIAVVAILLGVSAGRPPRVLEYKLTASGITIGPKHYPFSSFRSFTVMDEEAVSSIDLMPVKRFMPQLSIYYPPEYEEEIIDFMGNYLPLEHRDRDGFDRLMHHLRF